jgi:patatin-like phospholipase
MVMHNTSTDSPWLLSNNTQAKYNQPDRLLPGNQDRNLDIKLVDLVRATTAAPTYFIPQKITVGDRQFSFADGGITAFNNPALIAAVVATLPKYRLEWARGADRLLVVSVGTGSAAAASRRPHWTRLGQALDDLTRLIPFFMNGASFSQDLLCRVFGECRYGPGIDSEVGDLMHPATARVGSESGPTSLGLPADSVDPGDLPGAKDMFSYVRYDASLKPEQLNAAGVPERHHKAVRKLDAVQRIPELARIGNHAAEQVDVHAHFRGFL